MEIHRPARNFQRRYAAGLEATALMEEDKQLDEGPERFDPVLLTQPKAERLAWFEKECTIEHTNLLRARDAILQIICSPGEGLSLNRLGTMVPRNSPHECGNTTRISLLGRAG